MKDIRSQLPECPLAYEVPFIPSDRTALVIPVNATDIYWQEKMLPWTLASLINNTDLITKGAHLYIACEDSDLEDRIQTALKNFELPEWTIFELKTEVDSPYDWTFMFDINYWAFRDESNTHKLNFSGSHIIKPYPPISEVSPNPMLYDMTHCTIEQFRHAIKQLMGSQLAVEI